MAHKCICAVCGETFDRDVVQAVRFNSRRYAHQSCYPEGELVPINQQRQKTATLDANLKDEINRKDLLDYISKLIEYPNYARIQLQINDYLQKYKYTYSGIQKTLQYFYEILGNDIDKANGAIGIVPYVYQDAYKYFFQIYAGKQANLKKDIPSYLPQELEVKIKIPKASRKNIKLFELEE